MSSSQTYRAENKPGRGKQTPDQVPSECVLRCADVSTIVKVVAMPSWRDTPRHNAQLMQCQTGLMLPQGWLGFDACVFRVEIVLHTHTFRLPGLRGDVPVTPGPQRGGTLVSRRPNQRRFHHRRRQCAGPGEHVTACSGNTCYFR